MIQPRLTMVILSVAVSFSAGCAMIESPKSAARRMTRMFTPHPDDFDSDADQNDSKWDFVGKEGRADTVRAG